MAYERGVGGRACIAQWACNSIAIGLTRGLVQPGRECTAATAWKGEKQQREYNKLGRES